MGDLGTSQRQTVAPVTHRIMALREAVENANSTPVVTYPTSYSDAPFVARIAGEGGGIHIKPSHKGRLTELKARTGKTEAELYNDGNPAHKRMVVFARNARNWKHGDGGKLNLFFDGGD